MRLRFAVLNERFTKRFRSWKRQLVEQRASVHQNTRVPLNRSRARFILSNDTFAAGGHLKIASFLVNERRGAATLLKFGMNGPIYVPGPRNDKGS